MSESYDNRYVELVSRVKSLDELFDDTMGINPSIIRNSDSDVMLLPSNYSFLESADAALFRPHSKRLLHEINQQDLNSELYNDGREMRRVELHDETQILPLLYIATEQSVQLINGILAIYIFRQFIDPVLGEDDKVEPNVELEIVKGDSSGNYVWEKIKGPASEVVRILKDKETTEEAIEDLKSESN